MADFLLYTVTLTAYVKAENFLFRLRPMPKKKLCAMLHTAKSNFEVESYRTSLQIRINIQNRFSP
jgi:hypothetical protein